VWLRDAALTLEALMHHGFTNEVEAWRRWLLRARARAPAPQDINLSRPPAPPHPHRGVAPQPRYDGAGPVRVGNAASEQYQADVFGEVMIALDAARHVGLADDDFSWSLQVALLGEAERNLDRPDSGIWEIRGAERRFTHSRAMLWAAFDRGVCAVEFDGRRGPVERWRAVRDQLAAEIENTGFDPELGSYVQFGGSREVDAALLQLPQIGYLAHDDVRMVGTVARIEQTLLRDGLLRRYRTEADVDGVPGDENAFLACSFWLVEHYAHVGRLDEADRLMERLLAFRSELGLLSEEVDARHGRQAGNTPQALSHLALVRAADAIAHAKGDAVAASRASAARSSRRVLASPS
jgi:GH15 family glucan-1,4-alpha-glucosidase